MKKIIYSLFTLILLQTHLYSCSLCAVMVPKVDVKTIIDARDDKTVFYIAWKFEKVFADSLTMYDVNENKKYEKPERDGIKEAILSYIEPINYLTNIEYIKKDEEFNSNYTKNIKSPYSEVVFHKDGTMSFNYKLELDFILKKDHKLFLNYFDGGGNFAFHMKDIILKGYKNFRAIEPRLTESYIYFYKDYTPEPLKKEEEELQEIPQILKTQEIEQTKKEADLIQKIEKLKEFEEDEGEKFLDILAKKLNEIKNDLESTLKDIKQNNSFISYFWLLLFSFVYGVLHAIGPGHGKSLVASYFINQNKSYIKAFSISSLIGIVHTFSAFFITLIIYTFVGLIFNSTLVNIEQTATKISAVIIIGIALYLIYKKLQKHLSLNKPSFKFKEAKNIDILKTNQVKHTQSLSCECSSCKTTSTDLGVVLAAGIIPCPGTVTIFIFTMSLGIYFVGFLSAVFMSAGMSLVIFITAVLSVGLRKSTSNNQTIVKILEYGSLFFILFLGIILLLVS